MGYFRSEIVGWEVTFELHHADSYTQNAQLWTFKLPK